MTRNDITVEVVPSDGKIRLHASNSYGGCTVYLTPSEATILMNELLSAVCRSKVIYPQGV